MAKALVTEEYKESWLALAGVAQWIEHGLQTKGSLVLFPVRAHTWIVVQVPSVGQPHIDVSLPLFLPPFPLSKNE